MGWLEGLLDGSGVDPVADRWIGGLVRALRRLYGARYAEAAVGPGFCLRLRIRPDGTLGSFAILRDRRLEPFQVKGEYGMVHAFARPFRAWSGLASALRDPQAPLPRFCRLDATRGLLILEDEGGCTTLPLAVVAAVDARLRPCLDAPELTVAEGARL